MGFSEVQVASFDDPYQVPRVLAALVEAPTLGSAQSAWVEKVMRTKLLARPTAKAGAQA